MNKRKIAVDLLQKFIGTPYKWGGDDPLGGFDCSGLMVDILQSTGKMALNRDATAHNLSKLFSETEIIQPGVMVFWDWNNDGKIDHVEMVALVDDDGSIFTIGASGGSSTTTNRLSAEVANAYVKLRPLRDGYMKAVDPFY